MFFSYVGHDPMREIGKERVKSIAVVNEDLGFDFENNSLELGKEVSEILGKTSSYQWVTVNRKTAETGLNNGQYEAVLYLPSTFTENVLSFVENQPKEASLTYKIQPNLNAERAEKVQKELETARSSINTNMSMIYWDYVSQSVDDIRKKFDGILEKEIAFQNTMYDFYSPSSQALTSEIGSQKQMLEGILSSAGTAGQTTAASIDGTSSNKSGIEAFLKDIQTFKQYQLNQNQLIEKALAENQSLLTDSLQAYDSVIQKGVQNIISNSPDDLTDNKEAGQQLYEDVTVIQQQLEKSNKALEELNETIASSNTKEQFDRLLQLQKENMKLFKNQSIELALNQTQPKLVSAREKLLVPNGSNQNEVALPEVSISQEDLSQLKEKIASIEAAALEIKDSNSTLYSQLINTINEMKNDLQLLQQKIAEQQKWMNLVKESNGNSENAAQILVNQIKVTEQRVLQSAGLSENRKNMLSNQFSKEIVSRNMNDLIQYITDLTSFEGQLSYFRTTDESIIEGIIAKTEDSAVIESAFQQIKAETQLFYQLHGSLNDSMVNVNQLEDDFYEYISAVFTIINEFQSYFSNYQNVVVSNLAEMEEGIEQISEQLVRQTNTPSIEPVPEGETGDFLLAMYDETLSSLQTISDMVDGISTQQDTIREQTDDLYASVSTVQDKVDDLNNRWSQNVETTEQVRDDVYNILGNTLVDEQENPFMYRFLSNPVSLSGAAFEAKATPSPPVIMLVIILICSLLIGYFLYQYNKVKRMVHILLFSLLTITLGLIISIYGLNIYSMPESQAIKWTVLTILVVMAVASLITFAFFIGTFAGSLLTVIFIAFFTTPLLDLILPNFNVTHPLANVFLNLQMGNQDGLYIMIAILILLTVISSSAVYMRFWNPESSEERVADEI